MGTIDAWHTYPAVDCINSRLSVDAVMQAQRGRVGWKRQARSPCNVGRVRQEQQRRRIEGRPQWGGMRFDERQWWTKWVNREVSSRGRRILVRASSWGSARGRMVKCLNSIVDYGRLRSVYSWTAMEWRGEGARCTRAAECGCERKECKKQISRRNRPAPERRA